MPSLFTARGSGKCAPGWRRDKPPGEGGIAGPIGIAACCEPLQPSGLPRNIAHRHLREAEKASTDAVRAMQAEGKKHFGDRGGP
jgi:hypothetical protein